MERVQVKREDLERAWECRQHEREIAEKAMVVDDINESMYYFGQLKEEESRTFNVLSEITKDCPGGEVTAHVIRQVLDLIGVYTISRFIEVLKVLGVEAV
jgi:hypothetical protein